MTREELDAFYQSQLNPTGPALPSQTMQRSWESRPHTLQAQAPANPVDRLQQSITDSDWFRSLPMEAQRMVGAGQGAAEFLPPVAAARGGYELGAGGASSDYGRAAVGLLDTIPELGKGTSMAVGAALPAASKAKRVLMEGDRLVGPTGKAVTVPGGSVSQIPVRQQVAGTVGSATPDVRFEGVSPHEFTPGQWGRFGKQYDVPNLGPESDEAFAASLVPYQTKSGREYTVPGGHESNEPFSYYDMLHMKSQGIDPNDLDPALHQNIHDRNMRAMQPGAEGPSREQIFNGLTLGMISPNQPLTPNELAQARVMAKGPEDINRIGGMLPWDYKDSSFVTPEMRHQYSGEIASNLGVQAQGRGGLGVSGSADYTRIAEMAQMYEDKPDFFKFKGAAEGGADSAENWANYVQRLSNQVPGLSAKTGSFGGVWQSPEDAAISAIDRHMVRKFTTEMFPTKAEADAFKDAAVTKYREANPGSKATWDTLPRSAQDDASFGYLNNHPEMKYRVAKTGEINERVPESLRNVDWVKEPDKVAVISEPYKRTLSANAASAGEVGQGTFSNQWMEWDRIRKRLEPHEIMFPGLEKLPRMSMPQMGDVRQTYKDAGYLAGPGQNPNVKPFNPSRGAYFALPPALLAGLYGASQMTPEEEEERRRYGS
jgi:hypothetical protein